MDLHVWNNHDLQKIIQWRLFSTFVILKYIEGNTKCKFYRLKCKIYRLKCEFYRLKCEFYILKCEK
jgi:hypothetical protein